LIENMRDADWSTVVPGIYGALLIAIASPEASRELKAFISGMQIGEMDKGILFLLRKNGMLEGR
jgi:hypothetical protein